MSLVGLPTGPSIACVFRGGSTTRINGSPRTSASLSSDPCSWVWASSTRRRRSPPLPRCFGSFRQYHAADRRFRDHDPGLHVLGSRAVLGLRIGDRAFDRSAADPPQQPTAG